MEQLINTITINKANLEHIAKTGKINGSLLAEIKRVMNEYDKSITSHHHYCIETWERSEAYKNGVPISDMFENQFILNS